MDPITMDEVNLHTTAEIDTLHEKLGKITDTGGTEKQGTLFAKVNALINVIAPSSGHEEFTIPGTHTFTVPGNVKSLNVTVIGGGGGGGGGAGTGIRSYQQTVNHCAGSYEETHYRAHYGYAGSPGGNGATVTKTISVTPGTALTLIVGGGGKAGSGGGVGGNGSSGAAGSPSSVTNHATASGGAGGSGGGNKAGTYASTSAAQALGYLNYSGLTNYQRGGSNAPGGGGYGGAGGAASALASHSTAYGSSGRDGQNGKIIIEW